MPGAYREIADEENMILIIARLFQYIALRAMIATRRAICRHAPTPTPTLRRRPVYLEADMGITIAFRDYFDFARLKFIYMAARRDIAARHIVTEREHSIHTTQLAEIILPHCEIE